MQKASGRDRFHKTCGICGKDIRAAREGRAGKKLLEHVLRDHTEAERRAYRASRPDKFEPLEKKDGIKP